MSLPIRYTVLTQQKFQKDNFYIVPIRFEDRFKIMDWRNEQLYHLRQAKPLTAEDQENYFANVVAKLYNQTQPAQLLFSFLEGETCIGYGGLVHINWIDKNAEISFIMNTTFERERFAVIWEVYLDLIEQVAFKDLKLHKIYTYAFDLRPHLYEVLTKNNFVNEALLKEHCFFEGKFIDVVIHTKINRNILLRKATETDVDVTFRWANNPVTRRYSINKEPILYEEHCAWFFKKISVSDCFYLIAEMDNERVGSIRFDIDKNGTAVISYLLDTQFHGKGLGRFLLFEGVKKLIKEKKVAKISGLVFKENIASMKAFTHLGYDVIDNGDAFVYFEKGIH